MGWPPTFHTNHIADLGCSWVVAKVRYISKGLESIFVGEERTGHVGIRVTWHWRGVCCYSNLASVNNVIELLNSETIDIDNKDVLSNS